MGAMFRGANNREQRGWWVATLLRTSQLKTTKAGYYGVVFQAYP